ncbi:GspH/FimT family pseudopilin [Hydrocarboniclastica marina]|uniref:Type II secretion system protein H n=1 Tax=Hydrocarboniclastica marina TaxID=2259620 RepID=A0A4P7XDX6_9ALTE|nr:GspH/FimT family pseudopilin [Hydrocarboniclastica marina]QCF25109.1 prepilin-type N-terminal cleavage/methylation domain-containing protein [Hydrocarboniclastica marina]
MIYHRQRAFSLVELITAIAILAITVSFAVSSMQPVSARTTTRSVLAKVYAGFQFARSAAVNKQQLVTICPLDGNGECINDWNQPISIFLDPSNERSLTDGNLLQLIPATTSGSLIAQPASKRYFQFRPIGTVHGTLGNVTFCPQNGDAIHAGQLILSSGGRLRYARDRDQDGVAEGSDGSPISCTRS